MTKAKLEIKEKEAPIIFFHKKTKGASNKIWKWASLESHFRVYQLRPKRQMLGHDKDWQPSGLMLRMIVSMKGL